MLDRWFLIAKVWTVEASAMMVLAVAGFAVQRRGLAGPAWFPAPVAWTMVGLGALMQAVMYAFMLGGYPSAAAEEGTALALDGAMRGSAMFLFQLGNAALYLGLGGAVLAEASPVGAMPRWLALAGSAVCFVTAALMVGLLWGVGEMLFAAPMALLGFLVAAYLGVSIWRRG